ncbi:hypothetical protein Tco_0524924 [Tanacetum coccineum]
MANLDFYDKHNMVAYLQKSEGCEGFHQIIDFLTKSHIRYALTESPTIYVSLIEQFWQTTSASTLENGDMEITATIDGKVKVVSEASIRRHLKLEDSDGISTLPTSEIFEQLALIGAPSTSQPPTSPPSMQITYVAKEATTMPHDLPLLKVYSLGSDEGSMTLNELTVLCTTLSKKVETLESDLKQTKLTYGAAYTKLIMKVKKLEHKVKSSKARRRVRLVVSEDEDELEDPSKQGRKIAQIDEDEGITLVQMSAQTQGRHEHDFEESDFEFIAPEEDYTAEPDISTANVPVSTAGAEVSTASPEVKTAAESLVYIRRSAAKRKDKGKAIMKEAEPVQKKTKLQLEQERLGLEEALRLQEQLDEEERQRIARVHEEASTFNAEEWDNIQAQIEADEELAHRLQAQERERYSEADKARLLVELINERKRKFAQQRAEQRRNKPMTQAQQRTYMCNYIKNMGSHTLQQLKKLSFDEVKELFETTMKRVNTFTPMESDDTVPKVVAGSSKIDAEQELNQESSKRQKIGEGSEPAEESKDELSQEQLQQLMIIVPEEGMNVEALQTKYPIIDWEVYTEDSRKYWKIIRVGNHTEVELKRLFEPDDDDTLWKLQRYMHDPLKWKLYDTCVVHHVSIERGHDIFMLVEKDYPLTRALMTLMLSNKLQMDEYSVMADELLRKIFILANRPRQGIIMEYLVEISKKACILELKQRNMNKTNSDIQYAVSIKEDTTYLCLHFTKAHEENKINTPYPENPIRRSQVIECEYSGRYRTWIVCKKEKDSDVMLVELIKNNDCPGNEDLEEDDDVLGEEEFRGDHFDKFLTRSELAYHKTLHNWIMTNPLKPSKDSKSPSGIRNFTGRVRGMPIFVGNLTYTSDFKIVEDICSVIDPRMSWVILGKPFVEVSNMTYDLSLGIVKFTNKIEEIAYNIPHKIEQYDSLSDMEKENTKSVYFRNEKDKRKGVEHVMDKILVIMECLVKIRKKARILELKRRNTKIIVLTTNTPYPARKIRLRKKYCLSLKNDMPSRDKSCMIRSSTKELFTHFKEPEREFRSSWKHFKTLSLSESRSPDFNLFSDQEEYSEQEFAETMAKTMEQYMSKTRADYGSGVARPNIEEKDNFELKGQFFKELCTNTFSGSDHEDANQHIEKVLEIVDLFHIPNITIDQVMLRAFPVSLIEAASCWLRNKPSITNWEDLRTKQILDSRGAIPSKTNADAKVAIQEMAEYSQKWHNGTSRTRSPHYTKDCPLKEEGKALEEAYFTQFGAPFQ